MKVKVNLLLKTCIGKVIPPREVKVEMGLMVNVKMRKSQLKVRSVPRCVLSIVSICGWVKPRSRSKRIIVAINSTFLN